MFHRAGTIETEFKHLGTRLDELLDRAELGAADADDDARSGVADLKAKHRRVRERLDELRASGDDKWDILKEGIENAWKDLENAYEKLSD